MRQIRMVHFIWLSDADFDRHRYHLRRGLLWDFFGFAYVYEHEGD